MATMIYHLQCIPSWVLSTGITHYRYVKSNNFILNQISFHCLQIFESAQQQQVNLVAIL